MTPDEKCETCRGIGWWLAEAEKHLRDEHTPEHYATALRLIRAALKAHEDDEDHMPYMQTVLDVEEAKAERRWE